MRRVPHRTVLEFSNSWCAVLLASNFQVYGTVRKQADATRLQTEFGSDFFPLLLDVTDESALRSAAAQVKERLGQATLARNELGASAFA